MALTSGNVVQGHCPFQITSRDSVEFLRDHIKEVAANSVAGEGSAAKRQEVLWCNEHCTVPAEKPAVPVVGVASSDGLLFAS